MNSKWISLLTGSTRPFGRARAMRFALTVTVLWILATHAVADEETEAFFEREIRPVLIDRCLECHSSDQRSGGLQLTSRELLLAGGDSGAAIVPGDSASSLLVKAIRHQDGMQMPPKEELSEPQIAAIARWIDIGAPWPGAIAMDSPTSAAGEHWAFQPVRKTEPRSLVDPWCQTLVDPYVKAKLDQNHLTPARPADRHTLARRISYTLTGLPPSAEDLERFTNDTRPNALELLVERLLASPAYGEHWARHWLDVARYSDTKGYVYAREERHWVHAWSYRDWVVQAFNENMAYDRFLLLQLAADQVEERRQSDLAAIGLLTLGRRFLGVDRDIIDDRIDVVCRGMLGLTVSCARCHDHKYDPIPTADYYSLYGVFDSCQEDLVCLDKSLLEESFADELAKRQQTLNERLASSRQESTARCRQRVKDYLIAQTELHKYPANGFDQVFSKTDLLPDFVRQWEAYIYEAKRRSDPIFTHWHAYASLSEAEFSALSAAVTKELTQLPPSEVNVIIASHFQSPPKSFRDVVERYGEAFTNVLATWETLLGERDSASNPPSQLADPAAEQLRQVLYGENGPCAIPAGGIVHAETFFDSGTCTELWKLQGEVDRHIINSKLEAPFALILRDRGTPVEPRIFRRGNPLNQGESVPRKFLSVLAGDDSQNRFQNGSGRHELALAIISPDNPLTARVIVNRVWAKHFGVGLVETASDFGRRAEKPEHLELLDALAAQFVREGWDLKKLHRWILLSATYGQASSVQPGDAREHAMSVDPDNRLLWRMNPRRLSFEEFRDSLLAATHELDHRLGGKPGEMFQTTPLPRRTLYGKVDRQYLPAALRVFDFANPDLHVAERSETTVPQQALFLMNHPLVLDRARKLASIAAPCTNQEDSIQLIFARTLQRKATENELADAAAFLNSQSLSESHPESPSKADWQYGYGRLDEEAGRVEAFQELPHFTGSAWQGGAQFPDKTLGWVQLTATGGHPGNDREHAAIRRWIAPRAMSLEIRSELIHDRPPGDGVRAFIVSSADGVLAKAVVHQDTARLDVGAIQVKPGDSIDFVVDIGDVLNSDEHLWRQTLTSVDGKNAVTTETDSLPKEPEQWDSAADFTTHTTPTLDPMEQLAQILFCANEFVFVD